MLATDREEVDRHFLTVTTRNPDMPLSDFRQAFQSVAVKARRRYGRFDYYGTIEQTSGLKAADGRRRIHGHFITKGITGPVANAEKELRSTWERSTFNSGGEEGRAHRVTLSEVGNQAAMGAYLGTYISKPDQMWTEGRRIRSSQGFFPESVTIARARAQGELMGEAQAWREGYRGDDPAIALYAELGAVNAVLAEELRRDRRIARAELAEVVSAMAHDAADDVAGSAGLDHTEEWVPVSHQMELEWERAFLADGVELPPSGL